jgi:hypothetical protein
MSSISSLEAASYVWKATPCDASTICDELGWPGLCHHCSGSEDDDLSLTYWGNAQGGGQYDSTWRGIILQRGAWV